MCVCTYIHTRVLVCMHTYLVNLGQTLLALVHVEVGPEREVRLDLLQGLGVVLAQPDLFPEVLGGVSALNRFYPQVANPLVLMHRGIAAVGKRAALSVTQTGDVLFVPAEVLRGRLGLEGAEMLVDDTPDHIVVLHGY
jgi:hypothetical protein